MRLNSRMYLSSTKSSLYLLLVLGLAGISNGKRRNVSSITGGRPQTRQNGCSFQFRFTASGQSANLDSPNYPDDYTPNSDCTYQISSPPGTQMIMRCDEFNVETSPNCKYDIFYTSMSGKLGSSDQQFVCGRGVLDRTSDANQLAVRFISDASNLPADSDFKFNFRCRITVVGTATPEPPACTCGNRNEESKAAFHSARLFPESLSSSKLCLEVEVIQQFRSQMLNVYLLRLVKGKNQAQCSPCSGYVVLTVATCRCGFFKLFH